MSMTSSLDQYPQRDGLYRILPEGVAVHNRYQNRVMLLDSLSSELWLLADGQTSLRSIAQDIAGRTRQRVELLTVTTPMLLTVLASEGLMYQLDQPTSPPYHLTLPQEDLDENLMHSSMVASGWLDE
jgi:hypothetical protein